MDGSNPAPTRPGGPLEFLRGKALAWFLGAILAASLLIWVPIVGRFSLEDPQPIPVHPARINQDPRPYLGRRVRMEGEVERIYGPRAFALDRPALADGSRGENKILIIGKKPWSLLQRNPQVTELIRNDHVQVMGRVKKFRLREFQEESGGNPADSLLARWEGRPVLVALDIELTPGVPDLFPAGPDRRGIGGGDPPRRAVDPGPVIGGDSVGTPLDTSFGTPR